MRKIVLASNNKHKVKEFKEILDNFEILTLEDINFDSEIEETGKTFLENALIKAKEVSKYIRNNGLIYDVLADDSGLCVTSLNGSPGVLSARYAGDHDSKKNRDKLIKDLDGKEKAAYFNSTIVLYHSNGTYEVGEGKTYGKIIDKELGDTSFGYDSIFLSDDLGKTFGQATPEEKNSVSHRYRALFEIKKYLDS